MRVKPKKLCVSYSAVNDHSYRCLALVSIFGGYSEAWARDIGAYPTRVTWDAADARGNIVVVHAEDLGASTELQGLEIEAPPNPTPSGSVYGLHVNGAGTHLIVRTTKIVVGDGASGVNGVMGTKGDDGDSGNPGFDGTSDSCGASDPSYGGSGGTGNLCSGVDDTSGGAGGTGGFDGGLCGGSQNAKNGTTSSKGASGGAGGDQEENGTGGGHGNAGNDGGDSLGGAVDLKIPEESTPPPSPPSKIGG